MKQWILIGVVALGLSACTGAEDSSTRESTTESTSKTEYSREDRIAEIAEMEGEIANLVKAGSSEMLDTKASRILLRYRDYVSLYPRDSMTAEYLFKAADLSLGINKPEASIKYLDRLNQDFPTFRKNVEMWLFKGFIYENYLNNHAMAVKTYRTLIERYPNHRLANDAQASIDNLTLSDEELIEKFKAKNTEKGV